MSDFHKKVSILVQFRVVANILRLVQSPDYQSVIFSSGCLVLLIISSDFGFDTCFKMGFNFLVAQKITKFLSNL